MACTCSNTGRVMTEGGKALLCVTCQPVFRTTPQGRAEAQRQAAEYAARAVDQEREGRSS